MIFKESVEILKKIWKEKKLDQAETEALGMEDGEDERN